MASELTFRGGAAPGSASNGGEYSPKPSKKLSWLTRSARYATAEHRPLFALAGMLFAAALFAFSSSASPPSYYPAASGGFNHLAVASGRYRPLPDSVGGKVPLGLKRRARCARARDGRRRVRWEPSGGPAGGARGQRDRG
ncbi:hypothetical protein PR202_gb20482 [Eleusine coracana subsp. coracana]|uniref:Uncharacterized protein n=1 Tax=Eleusine coracana subsp. coracana TaxID=191504 RepID=A0AAV5FAR3_ELECO|nr:hypothetical protein PR202_gb20482 [Eleusine coracana subsp. coracana]